MYSPVDLPSSTRAAPAKKRRLSAETGSSSRAAGSGLPTLVDSSCASSSACSSISSASLSRISARSPGVVSNHSGQAFFAASTARSTSAAVPRGTSAIASPVAGFSTSIVPPSAASTHSPPTKFLYSETVTLISPSSSSVGKLHRAAARRLRRGRAHRGAAADAGLAGQALRDHDGDDRQQDDDEGDDVDDRELLALAEVVPDEDRQRRLVPGGEQR